MKTRCKPSSKNNQLRNKAKLHMRYEVGEVDFDLSWFGGEE